MQRGPKTVTLAAAAIGCYAILAAFWGLGSFPLIDPDEPRYAQSAREMIARGDYLVPYLDGQLRLNKPPLFYWLEIGSFKLLGKDREFAARLPSAVAALAAGLVAYCFARRLYGQTAAAFVVPLLFSMPLFAGVTHLSTTDATLTAFLTAALYCWWRGREAPAVRKWVLLSWAMLAAAVLTKGPVAIALYALAAVAFALPRKEWALLRRSFHILGVAVFLILVLPWPVAILLWRPETASLWYRETVLRFVSGVDHGGNPFAPLSVVVAGTLPWILAVGLPAGAGIRGKIVSLVAGEKGFFLFTWAATTVVFFAVCRTNLANYVLPAVPAVAIAAAGSLGRLWDDPKGPAAPLVSVAIGAGVLVVGGVGYAVHTGRISAGEIALIGTLSSLGTVIAAVLLAKGRLRVAALFLVAVVASGTALGTVFTMREVSARRSLEPLARAWRLDLKPAEELYFLGEITSNASLVYYTRRPYQAVKTRAQHRAALAGVQRIAIVQRAGFYEASIDRGEYSERHFLAGRCRIGQEEFVLVTNFPTGSSRPILGTGAMGP